MGQFDGKVVLVTGAARGQGRSHCLRFAEEGADVIAVDVCAQFATVPYAMSTPADLASTVARVEALDRRIVAREVDVRDAEGLRSTVADGVAELGRLDFVLANAGIISAEIQPVDAGQTFADVLATNVQGVWNTVHAALPTLIEQGSGGSVVITSSTGGLKGIGGATPGGEAYTASKHAVVGLMRSFAVNYAKHNIRFNTVHPTGVNTPMIVNELMMKVLQEAPDLIGATDNLLPGVQLIEPEDVTAACLWLCSEGARYVTGVTLPVDAGLTVK